jgi:hypothetical protein
MPNNSREPRLLKTSNGWTLSDEWDSALSTPNYTPYVIRDPDNIVRARAADRYTAENILSVFSDPHARVCDGCGQWLLTPGETCPQC